MGASPEEQQWHVLNFFCDKEENSALTAFARGVRFHVIANAEKLDVSTELGPKYRKLVRRYLGADNGNDVPGDKFEEEVDTDSGVDVNDSSRGSSKKPDQDEAGCEDAEATLQMWLFAPLLENLAELASTTKSLKQETLQEWYHFPARFCELVVSEDGQDLEAVELKSTRQLEDQVRKVLPTVVLPKYITKKIDVPLHHASDLDVLDASDQPAGTPYHPCRVYHRRSRKTYFLKVVDNDQPQPTKRELDVLNRIKSLGLHDSMHVPVLEGIVAFDETDSTARGQKKIMGFLQTDIPNPTPLTSLIDPSIQQDKREKWAKEADRMKKLLHKHDIIWGDAKADNFMVDKDDTLWIIDFGGSYTEGWVDPELNESLEGDDMGTNKIVNALKDPVNNTCDPYGEVVDQDGSEGRDTSGRKRKRNDNDTDTTNDEMPSTKRVTSDDHD